MKKLVVAAMAILCSYSSVSAQYARDQAQSLNGVQSVDVVFGQDLVGRSEVFNNVTLELRKIGLRIEKDGADIILNLSVTGRSNVVTVDVQTRLDVEQRVIMPRTHDELQLVTWFYEDQERINNSDWSEERLRSEVMAGVNQFLNDYLTANGR